MQNASSSSSLAGTSARDDGSPSVQPVTRHLVLQAEPRTTHKTGATARDRPHLECPAVATVTQHSSLGAISQGEEKDQHHEDRPQSLLTTSIEPKLQRSRRRNGVWFWRSSIVSPCDLWPMPQAPQGVQGPHASSEWRDPRWLSGITVASFSQTVYQVRSLEDPQCLFDALVSRGQPAIEGRL